ncbi:MAG: phospholipase [Solirubrobacteraceae bacterium]|nr:phospholipase [Solirubrobacteraceae bacterium]
MSALVHRERPADGAPDGLLVLHHGRGADEHDLIGLADVFDPDRRLHVVTPGGPLRIAGFPGRHWYKVPRVGYPDPDTFRSAFDALAAFHDETWERTGIGPDRTVLGGFSMGAVMSYSTGLSGDRPAPAGIMPFSGFVPVVDGWAASTDDRRATRAFVAHGRHDPVIGVEFARDATERLRAAGLDVDYHESDVDHRIDPTHALAARAWIADTLPAGGSDG